MRGKIFAVLLMTLAISGCETVKMPAGQDMSSYQLITGAPVVAISVSDTRTKDKIAYESRF